MTKNERLQREKLNAGGYGLCTYAYSKVGEGVFEVFKIKPTPGRVGSAFVGGLVWPNAPLTRPFVIPS